MILDKLIFLLTLTWLINLPIAASFASNSPINPTSTSDNKNNSHQAQNKTIELDQMISSLSRSHYPTFKQMIEQRYIRALVVYSKTDFFFDKGQPKGIQIDYLKAYEKFLNKNIKKESDKVHILLIPVTFNELIPNLLA